MTPVHLGINWNKSVASHRGRSTAGQNIHLHNRQVNGFIYLRSSEVTAVVWWYSKPYQTQTYLLRQSIDWYVMLWMVSSVPCRRLLATVWQLLVASETCYGDHSRFAHSQWETALLCNDVSHWLGASLEPVRIFPGQGGQRREEKPFACYLF